MTPSPAEADLLRAMHASVNAYLTSLLAMADCVGTACPPVGGSYRHRLQRIQRRVSFEAGPEGMAETCAQVTQELEDYAVKAAGYLRCHEVELRRAASCIEQ